MLNGHPSVISARENAVRKRGSRAILHREIKPHKSFEEQLAILSARGLIMDDRYEMLGLLERIGYYHLSGYMLTLKERDGSFRKGVTASRVIKLYSLDQALRNLMRDMLDRIEITLKTQVSHVHTATCGPCGYYLPGNFLDGFDHDGIMSNIAQEIKRQWEIPFISHHLLEYDANFPLWVAFEVMMFGTTSRFFSGLLPKEKRSVATYFGVDYKCLGSWLRCLTDLRNICAHQGRLYNRIFTSLPKLTVFQDVKKEYDELGLNERRLFWQVVPVCGLLTTERLRKAFREGLLNCIEHYAASADLREIGFPNDWDAYLDRILEAIPPRQ